MPGGGRGAAAGVDPAVAGGAARVRGGDRDRGGQPRRRAGRRERVRDRVRRRRPAGDRRRAAGRRGDDRGGRRATRPSSSARVRRGATHAVRAGGDAATWWTRCARSRAAGSSTRSRWSGPRRRSGRPGTCCGPAARPPWSALAPAGVEVSLPAIEFLSEKTITGSYYGSADVHAALGQLAQLVVDGRLRPERRGLRPDRAGRRSRRRSSRLRRGEGARSVIVIDPELAGAGRERSSTTSTGAIGEGWGGAPGPNGGPRQRRAGRARQRPPRRRCSARSPRRRPATPRSWSWSAKLRTATSRCGRRRS